MTRQRDDIESMTGLDGPGHELATQLKDALLLSNALTRALTTADTDAVIRATLPARLRTAYDAAALRLRAAL